MKGKRKLEQLAALEAQLKEKSSGNQDNPSGVSVECHVTEHQPNSIDLGVRSADTVNRTDGVDTPDVPASPRTLNQIEEAIMGAMAGDSTASSEPEPRTIIDPARLHDPSGSYISPPSSLGSASGSGTFSGSDLPSPPPVFDSLENFFPEDMSALTFDFLGGSLGLDQLPTQDLSSTLQKPPVLHFLIFGRPLDKHTQSDPPPCLAQRRIPPQSKGLHLEHERYQPILHGTCWPRPFLDDTGPSSTAARRQSPAAPPAHPDPAFDPSPSTTGPLSLANNSGQVDPSVQHAR